MRIAHSGSCTFLQQTRIASLILGSVTVRVRVDFRHSVAGWYTGNIQKGVCGHHEHVNAVGISCGG